MKSDLWKIVVSKHLPRYISMFTEIHKGNPSEKEMYRNDNLEHIEKEKRVSQGNFFHSHSFYLLWILDNEASHTNLQRLPSPFVTFIEIKGWEVH